jgi:hypothetical protein
VAELERLGRALLEDPRDRATWQELAKHVARGQPPPEVLCLPEVVQEAHDELWRGAPVPGLEELAAALRAAVPDVDLVLATGEPPILTEEDLEGPEPRGAAPGPSAWPDHPEANRLLVGPDPDWVVSRGAPRVHRPDGQASRLWHWPSREVVATGGGAAAFSRDGRWVAMAEQDAVALRRLEVPSTGWRLGGLGARVVAMGAGGGGEIMVLTGDGVGVAVTPETREAHAFPVRWPSPAPERIEWTRRGLVYQQGHGVHFADARGRVVAFQGWSQGPTSLEAMDPLGFGVALRRSGGIQVYSTGGERVEELGWNARVAALEGGPTLRLALAEAGQLYLYEPSNPERTQPVLILPGAAAPAALFRPGGSLLVLTAGGLLREWTPARGSWEPAEDWRGFPGGVEDLILDDTGWQLEVRDGEGGTWRCQVHSSPAEPLEYQGRSLADLSISPGGPGVPGLPERLAEEGITAHAAHPARREVAVGLEDGAVELRPVDASGGPAARRIEAHEGPVRALCYAPDGRYLLSGGADGRVVVHRLGLLPPGPPPAPPG